MNGNVSNDDIVFDRLVDGELSLAERRELLGSLDSRTDGWRKCALAFLEAQAWREDACSVTSTAALPMSQVYGRESESAAPSSPQKRTAIRTAAQWLAVAAGLMIAFRFGVRQQERVNPAVPAPVPANAQVASESRPGGAVAANTVKAGDALNLWVRDDSGQMRRVRVPLVDANALDPSLGLRFQTGVPEDVRNRLRNQGLAVQSKRRYAPMWFDNGQPMIVPVEDTKIVPVSNKVY